MSIKISKEQEMNELAKRYLNAGYDIIAPLSRDATLVRARGDGQLYVKKLVDAAYAGVYRAVAGIGARGLPQILSIAPDGGRFAVVYKYITGITVREYIEKYGVMEIAAVKQYIGQLCRTLAELHRRGIVHRDITPSNTIIGNDGMCHIIDFGIARYVKENRAADTEILGTAGFASPEQFGFRQTDARSDIYSVGALMSYMLTGRLPGESAPHRELGNIIAKCTAMDPADRYASADALRAALVKGEGPRRRMVVLFVLLAVFAMFVAGEMLSSDPMYDKLKVVFGYLLFVFVPVSAIVDVFGIIGRLSRRKSVRIWIKAGIIFVGILLVPVIDIIIQGV